MKKTNSNDRIVGIIKRILPFAFIFLIGALSGIAFIQGPRLQTRDWKKLSSFFEKETDLPSSFPNPSHLAPMNGIDPSLADRYWEKWHLVTSRYRKDTGHTRIIYANDVAWNSMQRRLPKYPDGSMFAKAVFESAGDPVFPASIIPRVYKEVEFMKKDSAAFAKTEGWGFSWYFYDGSAERPPQTTDEINSMTPSCISCHTIIKDRDYVFAVPVFQQWYEKDPSVDRSVFEMQFKKVPRGELSEPVQRIIKQYGPTDLKTYQVYTMDEFKTGQRMAIVSVAKFTERDGLPHLVMGLKGENFVYTFPNQDDSCIGYFMTEHMSPQIVLHGSVCDGKLIPKETLSR